MITYCALIGWVEVSYVPWIAPAPRRMESGNRGRRPPPHRKVQRVPPISRRANGSGAAASMARARRAIGPRSSSRSLGGKELRSASPAPTCGHSFCASRGRAAVRPANAGKSYALRRRPQRTGARTIWRSIRSGALRRCPNTGDISRRQTGGAGAKPGRPCRLSEAHPE